MSERLREDKLRVQRTFSFGAVRNRLGSVSLCILFLSVTSSFVRAQHVDLTLGIWDVDGVDRAGGTWDESILNFTSQVSNGPNFELAGYFDWIGSNGGQGRELFVGTFFADRRLELKGESLEAMPGREPPNPFGIANASYEAQVNPLGTQIVGTWGNLPWGQPVIPGTWTATVPALGQPRVMDAGFQIQKFADVEVPWSVEIPPPGNPFGEFLYVAGNDNDISTRSAMDRISRVDLVTGAVESFFSLPGESGPLDMRFGSGHSFSSNLYISSNNRDFGQPGDRGGSIVFLEPDPTINGEQFLTPSVPPTVLSGPGGIGFGPGGPFGSELFVRNTRSGQHDIVMISPDGSLSTFLAAPSSTPLSVKDFAFGRGGLFGSDLYATDSDGELFRIDAEKHITPFAKVPAVDVLHPEFSPAGLFAGDLFVVGTINDESEVGVFRVTHDGDVSLFASGFGGLIWVDNQGTTRRGGADLEFSNDGQSLFIADTLGNAIYQITAAEQPDFSLDTICSAVAQGNSVPRFDLDDDGKIDLEDVHVFLNVTNQIVGDTDFDGKVAFSDFLTLSSNFGKSDRTWSHGDVADCDGTVNFRDFLMLSSNFEGSASGGEVASVPEPGSWSMLCLPLFVLACRRRELSRLPERLRFELASGAAPVLLCSAQERRARN